MKLTCNENHTNSPYMELHRGNAAYAQASYISGKIRSNRAARHET